MHMEQKLPTHTSFQQEIKIFTLDEIPLGTITTHLHFPFAISTLQEDATRHTTTSLTVLSAE